MKLDNQNKKLAMIVGAIIVIAVIALVMAPGLLPSIGATIFGTVSNCNDTPYDQKCICGTDERKISVPGEALSKWHCETVANLLIDPESPTFEDEAINYAQAYLTANCSACINLTCGGKCDNVNGPVYPCINAVYGYSSTGARVANIECLTMDATGGRVPWRMMFLVESKTTLPKAIVSGTNYCYINDTQKCTPPMSN